MDDKTYNRCKEAVCVQTKQIYDSCKSKECLEDIRVYLSGPAQVLVDNASAVKGKDAEIIWIFSDVEAVPFNRGFYTVELKYFFKINLEVCSGCQQSRKVAGLAIFSKKIVLFGSEGNSKVFTSKCNQDACDIPMWKKCNMPEAVVEVVDPILLSVKCLDTSDPCCSCKCECDCDCEMSAIPDCIQCVFDDALVLSGERRRLFATLGMFTMAKLQRDVQLMIPAYDFCVPDKECVASAEANPCELFESLNFPVDEFFPPTKSDFKAD